MRDAMGWSFMFFRASLGELARLAGQAGQRSALLEGLARLAGWNWKRHTTLLLLRRHGEQQLHDAGREFEMQL